MRGLQYRFRPSSESPGKALAYKHGRDPGSRLPLRQQPPFCFLGRGHKHFPLIHLHCYPEWKRRAWREGSCRQGSGFLWQVAPICAAQGKSKSLGSFLKGKSVYFRFSDMTQIPSLYFPSHRTGISFIDSPLETPLSLHQWLLAATRMHGVCSEVYCTTQATLTKEGKKATACKWLATFFKSTCIYFKDGGLGLQKNCWAPPPTPNAMPGSTARGLPQS